MRFTVVAPEIQIPRLLDQSAAEMARRISDRSVTSTKLVEASIRQIEVVNGFINAVAEPRFEQALEEAKAADALVAEKGRLGPLHGVPISVKQMIAVEGMKIGWGTTDRDSPIANHDAEVVAKMRKAGAIVVATTNVPQLGFFHETDNPIHGRTNHPTQIGRTCGGSSGGEAAIIATGCVPLGIGSDLGGSIRIPSHFCGIQGLMPTPRTVSTQGIRCLGMGHTLELTAGPMARRVEDLILALNVMACRERFRPIETKLPSSGIFFPCDSRPIELRQLRIGFWETDDYFSASPAIRRAVRESATQLANAGAQVEPFDPGGLREIVDLYVGLLSAGGGREAQQYLRGAEIDPRLAKVMRLASLWRGPRIVLATIAAWLGQEIESNMLRAASPLPTHAFWELRQRLCEFRDRMRGRMQAGRLDAVITPPYGLAATPHGRSMDLLVAAGYAFLPNLLGYPAGVVARTQVRAAEQLDRIRTRDRIVRVAAHAETNSTGLQVGVQVMAPPWREDIILAVLAELE